MYVTESLKESLSLPAVNQDNLNCYQNLWVHMPGVKRCEIVQIGHKMNSSWVVDVMVRIIPILFCEPLTLYCFPHDGVICHDNFAIKLRAIYDAWARTFGSSLNNKYPLHRTKLWPIHVQSSAAVLSTPVVVLGDKKRPFSCFSEEQGLRYIEIPVDS